MNGKFTLNLFSLLQLTDKIMLSRSNIDNFCHLKKVLLKRSGNDMLSYLLCLLFILFCLQSLSVVIFVYFCYTSIAKFFTNFSHQSHKTNVICIPFWFEKLFIYKRYDMASTNIKGPLNVKGRMILTITIYFCFTDLFSTNFVSKGYNFDTSKHHRSKKGHLLRWS